MRATEFEYRHQLLLHQLLVGAALLTYLIDPEDIVWRYIKNSGADARLLERWLFGVATLLFGISASICTAARAYAEPEAAAQSTRLAAYARLRSFRNLRYFGDLLYALALASLVPVSGAFVLVLGESIRLLRLSRRSHKLEIGAADSFSPPAQTPRPEWAKSVRKEAIKWGLFLTMIVFTITLKDRIAEGLIAATVLLWALLNLRLPARVRTAAPL